MITGKGTLELIYIGLTFIAINGVFQAAAAYHGFKGMSFFPRPLFAYIFCGVAVIAPLTVLFLWNYYFAINVVAGSQQAGLFFLTTIIVALFTMIVGELVHLKTPLPPGKPAPGLEALREGTFFRTFWRRIKVRG
jgi:hypothetical protein